MSKPDLQNYNARLQAMQEAAVTGTTSQVGAQIGPGKQRYWSNSMRAIVQSIEANNFAWWTINVESFLVAGPIGGNEIDENELLVLSDIADVGHYFGLRKQLYDGTVYSSNQAGFIPESLNCQIQGRGEYAVEGGLLVGSIYNFSWQHRVVYSRVNIP